MPVTYEMTVGLHVIDEAAYAEYRAGMTPLLQREGGGFRYDFQVAQTLKNEEGREINRVFVLMFPNRRAKERFFADTEYLAVREKWFEPSVAAVTILAEYERN
ncbi:MAG: DUF1330 domain-containing protein [Acidobacteria bacterium]|nr:DUF1330 domain-containing protein [Acidobacteriota bacterium]